MKGLSLDDLQHVAQRTEGFSGRGIAQMLSGVQAAVLANGDPLTLTAELWHSVVDREVATHAWKMTMLDEGTAWS